MSALNDLQSQQLRTEIARSRRRLDRHARQLAQSVRGPVSLGHFVAPGSGRARKMLLVAAGLVALWRAGLGRRWLNHWPRGLLGSTVFQWLERLGRQLRVMAWRHGRQARSTRWEAEHE